MDPRERYFWDITGYLILRDLLTPDEIIEANEAVDRNMDRMVTGKDNAGAQDSQSLRGKGQALLPNLLEWEKPYCEPFRKMLVHPEVVKRLNVMLGVGFRHDHGPWVSYSEKGTEGLVMHGRGEPHKPEVAYHHQDGVMYCGGVTVTWQLVDVNAGDGGFTCVPGSHKAKFPLPNGVRTCDDDMDLVIQPALKAGDVILFMDGAQTHGTHPWRNEIPRRSVLFKYASRTSVRSGGNQVAPPEIYWGEETVEGMTEEERAVMHGPGSIALNTYLEVDEDGSVLLKNKPVAQSGRGEKKFLT